MTLRALRDHYRSLSPEDKPDEAKETLATLARHITIVLHQVLGDEAEVTVGGPDWWVVTLPFRRVRLGEPLADQGHWDLTGYIEEFLLADGPNQSLMTVTPYLTDDGPDKEVLAPLTTLEEAAKVAKALGEAFGDSPDETLLRFLRWTCEAKGLPPPDGLEEGRPAWREEPPPEAKRLANRILRYWK